MGFFKSGAERQMDEIIVRLQMNMSNNYKDNAQENLRELEAVLADLKAQGKAKEKVISHYESVVGIYKERLKGFTHKDQKPYWT